MNQLDRSGSMLLASQAEWKLLKYIQEEPIPVGGKIPNEFELAALFGVSRSTIREAVKGLASKGVLEVCRGSGTFVLSHTTAQDDPLRLGRYHDKLQLALELFDVRLMLEPEIAAYAAMNATDEEIGALRALCDEMEDIYHSDGDPVYKDIELHTKIARSGKNRVVEELVPLIVSSVYTFTNVTNRQLMDMSMETHRAIVEAIAQHDHVGARCAMVIHLTYNRQMILRLKTQEECEGFDRAAIK